MTTRANANVNGSYARVAGLDMYTEAHGTGSPIVVLPGGLMTIGMMGPMLASLAATRQVIAVEPQAHGHTGDIERPLTYQRLADDAAALIAHLGLEKADVLGFSVGANIALQMAVRHPNRVGKLIVISGNFRGDGEFPEVRAIEASFDADMPMLAALREGYVMVAPRPEGWATLVAKMRQLVTESYDWSGEVAGIRVPTLIVVGDADTMPISHAAELFTLLGGGTVKSAMGQLANAQLAVLPGTTHFSLLHRIDLLLPIVTSFLDSAMPTAM